MQNLFQKLSLLHHSNFIKKCVKLVTHVSNICILSLTTLIYCCLNACWLTDQFCWKLYRILWEIGVMKKQLHLKMIMRDFKIWLKNWLKLMFESAGTKGAVKESTVFAMVSVRSISNNLNRILREIGVMRIWLYLKIILRISKFC